MQQWQVICNGIAASSSLTKLELDVVVYPEDQEHDGPVYVEVCAKLAGLTNLNALCMADSCLVPGDALALTALTGLTRLELKGTGAGVGDLAATAIASSCQQLRHLDLSSCELGSMVCLAVVRSLTQLTELQLEGNSGLTQQGLMLLTGLKQLRYLGVTKNLEVTHQVLQRFWRAVLQLPQW
uniref:Uncharacterized protein n=1 Tax=Tetradesmus obliquus TaxID=3088 RepID=A0A383VB07_TETOB|eukprot:jgi/Sobl393_1/6119/SZX61546.1